MQMLRAKPFCGATPVKCTRPTRVLRINAAQQQSPLKTLAIKRDEQAEASPSVLPLASVAALTTLFTASRAMAVEVPEVSAEDITIMAASQPDAGIQSVIVGLLFGTVVALLLVVTGGVAYINIKQWLDARQEKEDRDKEKAAPAAAASSSAAKSSGKEEDPNAVVPLKRANRIKKEKGKGFAAADQFTSRR